MTEKFTEEKYQKVVEFADKYFDKHKELAIPVNLESIYKEIFYSGIVEREKFRKLTQKFVLIALPKSRDWAHEQFVEKEKEYIWVSKNPLAGGRYKYLGRGKDGQPIALDRLLPSPWDTFTETEVREACYDPEMFERKELNYD